MHQEGRRKTTLFVDEEEVLRKAARLVGGNCAWLSFGEWIERVVERRRAEGDEGRGEGRWDGRKGRRRRVEECEWVSED